MIILRLRFLPLLLTLCTTVLKGQNTAFAWLNSSSNTSREHIILEQPRKSLDETKQLAVGSPVPYFFLDQVDHYTQKTISPEQFRGKWLILDFFTKNCLACFASFPKINSLQKEFKDKIQFLLIGDNEQTYGKNIKPIFEKIRERQGLELPVAYDSVLFKQWKITAVPYVVIIDKQGIVRAINNSQDLNVENLNALMNSNDASSFRNISYEKFDPKIPYLINDNGGDNKDYLFRSVLGQWKRPLTFYGPVSIEKYNKVKGVIPGFQTTGAPISALYKMAFFGENFWYIGDPSYGKIARLPIFEGIDSLEYMQDSKTGRNMYNYSLTVPKEKASTNFIMKVMQRDLENYFGYKARIEMRKMPYWSITADEQTKKRLRTSGVKYYNDKIRGTGMEFSNYPFSVLLEEIFLFHQHQPPFIDETGFTSNIDIKFNALFTDLKSIIQELKRQGIDMRLKEREMEVLVISK